MTNYASRVDHSKREKSLQKLTPYSLHKLKKKKTKKKKLFEIELEKIYGDKYFLLNKQRNIHQWKGTAGF